MELNFYKNKEILKEQYNKISWIDGSGLSEAELKEEVEKILISEKKKPLAKAKIFELILTKGKIAIDEEDIFQDKLIGRGIMLDIRNRWHKEVTECYLKE